MVWKRKVDQTGLTWELHVDGASNVRGASTDIILTNLDGKKLHYALHDGFQASNNEAEYEAFIVGVELAQKFGAKNLRIHCDLQLIVNHVKDYHTAKKPNMVSYLAKTNSKLDFFSWIEIL